MRFLKGKHLKYIVENERIKKKIEHLPNNIPDE